MTTLKKFAAVVRLNIRLQLMDPTPTLNSEHLPSCYDSFYGACF